MKPLGVTLRVVEAEIPGAGLQRPTTACAVFDEAYVIGSTLKALRIRLPLSGREFWLARSQCCSKPGIDSLDQHSRVGDHGKLLLPLFITKRLFRHAKEVPAKP